MPAFVESLESRTLLSTAPSVATLGAESKIVLADLAALDKVGKSNFKTIETDLKIAGELKTSGPSLKALAVEGTAGFKVTSAAVKSAGKLVEADAKKLVAAAATLQKHPTVTADQEKVTTIEQKLQGDAAAGLTKITSAVTTEHDTNSANLTAIEHANPGNTKLASDVSTTIAPNTAAARDALLSSATTTLTTDVTAVIAAFPA
jgi:hypothetical protein